MTIRSANADLRRPVATTLQKVDAAPRRWTDYRGVAPDELIEETLELARSLRGTRVLQINATSYGGGVAELLSSQIGLLQDAGVAAEWHLLCPDAGLFDVTKRMHNGMQGKDIDLSDDDLAVYLGHNQHCAHMIADEWDVIVVHDPQPAAIAAHAQTKSARWIWRCHIDTSTPDPDVWAFLRPYVDAHDAFIFTLDAFRPDDLDPGRTALIAPAIDPLSSKNAELPRELVDRIVVRAGIDPTRPLMIQVSRFDPWKDPLGVVDAWRLARDDIADLQLALVGSMADDDPEGFSVYETVRRATAADPDCQLLTNRQGIGATEVNALQRHADVVVQKSLREGFGLTVSEALWKDRPVIGGRAGGIPLQIGDDEAGVLVDSVEECAAAAVSLLRDTGRARQLGAAGRERVRQQFLTPRLVRDELALYQRLLAGQPSSASVGDGLHGG